MSGERFTGGAPMVGWYRPRQILATAAKVIASSAKTDYRAIQALGEYQEAFSYRDRDELWLDYVADLGDGWNPTYAVARAMAAPALEIGGETLPTGQLLIMGGDQVYPTASRDEYRRRLRRPYEAAFREGESEPRNLFGLPGNHDWYDGLSSFMRLFCQEDRSIGALRTPQCRSYFALELPHDWWLLALDIQLEADIDQPQLAYFDEVAVSRMKPGDRVIVCTATPGWIEPWDSPLATNFRFIERQIHATGARVHLWLAGDLHCYARHRVESDGATAHQIIAGGGGAFLHPTHGADINWRPPEKRYPEARPSRWLSLGNLLFFYKNPGFGLLLGALFAVFGASISPWLSRLELSPGAAAEALTVAATGVLSSPFALLLALSTLAGAVAFAGARSAFGWIAGPLLGLAMLIAAALAAWISVRAAMVFAPETGRLVLAEAALYTFVIGGAAGLVVMGLFLTAANLSGRMLNNGFSALRIERYKNFLRLRIGAGGSLTVYAIGLDRVPDEWRRDQDGRIVPEGEEPSPHLIERIELFSPET